MSSINGIVDIIEYLADNQVAAWRRIEKVFEHNRNHETGQFASIDAMVKRLFEIDDLWLSLLYESHIIQRYRKFFQSDMYLNNTAVRSAELCLWHSYCNATGNDAIYRALIAYLKFPSIRIDGVIIGPESLLSTVCIAPSYSVASPYTLIGYSGTWAYVFPVKPGNAVMTEAGNLRFRNKLVMERNK